MKIFEKLSPFLGIYFAKWLDDFTLMKFKVKKASLVDCIISWLKKMLSKTSPSSIWPDLISWLLIQI